MNSIKVTILVICCLRALEFKHIQIDTSVCGNHTFPGSFVRGINEIRILIRQAYFNAQKGLLNKQSLAEKLHNKIPTSCTMPNGYFQEKRFQKPNIRFTSLSQLTLRESNHSN